MRDGILRLASDHTKRHRECLRLEAMEPYDLPALFDPPASRSARNKEWEEGIPEAKHFPELIN